jgi:SRSO17 transposase
VDRGGAVRDALARYVVRAFGDPAAVLVADEAGFLKKGRMSAGVQRPHQPGSANTGPS